MVKTKLETFLIKPRWVFLKIHIDECVVGSGEPLLEGRAQTIQTAIKETEPYLLGKDPRAVTHHWQAIYRHSFYKGGSHDLSGIDHALWAIKGKLLNVPVYELLGEPTRDRVRTYGRASTPEQMKQKVAEGHTVIKTGVVKERPARVLENPTFIKYAVENFAALRETGGDTMDIGIDLYRNISPQTAKILIKEPVSYQPMSIEEPFQTQNMDVLAVIARSTYLPIATGERIFTKWGFREILEKRAAIILHPDMCHAGGISEVKVIAGMAEAYCAQIAHQNSMGPISLAIGLQLVASIPNFLVQEQVSLGEGYLKTPFKLGKDGHVMIPTGLGLGIELDENKLSDKLDHD
ncbi:MAG: galactonate dehydratase [Arcticibacterium sp.]|jgi:galactonate dehydratase